VITGRASTTWEGARRTAARLLEIGQDEGGSSDERFWRPSAARYLAPLLFAAERGKLTMGDVLAGWGNFMISTREKIVIAATSSPT
jgi:hypothetical protein